MSHFGLASGFFTSDSHRAPRAHRKESHFMISNADDPRDALKRIPGLYRRWELPEILEPHRKYHIEEAGEHADGTPLLAVYASARDASGDMPAALID